MAAADYGSFRIESGKFPKFWGAHRVIFSNPFSESPNVVVTPNTEQPSLAGTFETVYNIDIHGFTVDSANGPTNCAYEMLAPLLCAEHH